MYSAQTNGVAWTFGIVKSLSLFLGLVLTFVCDPAPDHVLSIVLGGSLILSAVRVSLLNAPGPVVEDGADVDAG